VAEIEQFSLVDQPQLCRILGMPEVLQASGSLNRFVGPGDRL
jgi:hypothetical protein